LRFPGAYEINLRVGLRDTAPVLRALGLLPQSVQLVEGSFAWETALDQEAAHDCAGTADARPAMDVYTPARLHRVLDAVENLDHVAPSGGDRVVTDGFPQVLDADRQLRVVGLQLARLGKVHETLDAGGDQSLQSFASGLDGRAAGVLTGKHLAGDYPVAVA
jgi:hypothetical protein